MNGSMDYDRYEPARYAPDPATAERQGLKDLRDLASAIGADRAARILEIGCGGGSLLRALRSQGYEHCRGVDADERLVRHGRQVLGVEVAQGEWRSWLEGVPDRFDRIIALDVLEHLERDDVAATLRITRQRLAPGGRLVLRTPNALCPSALPLLYGDLTHRFILTPRLLVHLLREAGFDGPVAVQETRPAGGWKRPLFLLAHRLVVRPAVSLAHYYFHGEFPQAITANFVVVAEAGTDERRPGAGPAAPRPSP